jgi:hypothetical protein
MDLDKNEDKHKREKTLFIRDEPDPVKKKITKVE